jgi:sulfite reductase beta subunit-like hemoprotein
VARKILAHLGEQGRTMSWALSGCPNSCSQPQLADIGIVTSALVKGDDGERTPRFDICRRSDSGHLGAVVAHALSEEELYRAVAAIG